MVRDAKSEECCSRARQSGGRCPCTTASRMADRCNHIPLSTRCRRLTFGARHHRAQHTIGEGLPGFGAYLRCREQGSDLGPACPGGAQLPEKPKELADDRLHRPPPERPFECSLKPASFLQRCLLRDHAMRLSRRPIARNSPKHTATIPSYRSVTLRRNPLQKVSVTPVHLLMTRAWQDFFDSTALILAVIYAA
jgi:hypothetical protein